MTRLVPLNRDALNRVGVDLAKVGGGWMLVCRQCGAAWSVHPHILKVDYWKCPNGCAIPTPKPKPKRKPKPEPEPEPAEDPLEKAISEALAGYNLYQKKMREAQTDEETEAHRYKSEEFLDKYLGLVEARNAGGTEPKTDEQKRFEEAMDYYLIGGRK